jgi:hypothetical protein
MAVLCLHQGQIFAKMGSQMVNHQAPDSPCRVKSALLQSIAAGKGSADEN